MLAGCLARSSHFDLRIPGHGNTHVDLGKWLNHVEFDGAETLVYVGFDYPWDGRWIDVARMRVDRLRTRKVRVLFVADPPAARRLVGETIRELQRGGVSIIELAPWHDAALGYWLETLQISSEEPTKQRFRAVTGNWPFLLGRFLEKTEKVTGGTNWLQVLKESKPN